MDKQGDNSSPGLVFALVMQRLWDHSRPCSDSRCRPEANEGNAFTVPSAESPKEVCSSRSPGEDVGGA